MSEMRGAQSTVNVVIDELEANRAMFEALCQACQGERLERAVPAGHWTVQDHLAHVASFDELAVGLLRGDGRMAETALASPDSETWNEAQVARRAGRSLAMLLDEMAAWRERSVGLLAQQTDNSLSAEIYFSGDARRAAGMISVRLWLESWSRHDMVHARWILSALPELAVNSDYQSWLADDPVLDAMEREEGRG
jgi:uncharacterized damage-inducible protein DinB